MESFQVENGTHVKSWCQNIEASGAYKDVVEVMNSQKDLVEIVVELSPLAVIKG